MSVWAVLMLVSGGVFAGGVLAFAWERIPAWRTMPMPLFMTDFAVAIHRADRVQPALLVVSVVTTVGFAIGASGAARTLALIGATGYVVTLIASGAVLVPLQRRIIASSEEQAEAIEAMRQRWFTGHVGRSALAVASFTLAAIAAVV